jgi:hypothetical protein
MKGNILNFMTESAIPPFRFAKTGSSDNSVALAGVGEEAIGVSLDINSATSSRCDIQLDGIHMLELGGSVDYGDKLIPDATGRGVSTEEGAVSYAVALDSGVEGDVIRIKIEAQYTPLTPVTPPDPVTHTVTLPAGTGYTAAFVAGSSSPAAAGSIVNFTVVATEGYDITSVTDGTNDLTAVNGVYTINEIAADTTIVVVATLLGE